MNSKKWIILCAMMVCSTTLLVAGEKTLAGYFTNTSLFLELCLNQVIDKDSAPALEVRKHFKNKEVQDYYYASIKWQEDTSEKREEDIVVGPYWVRDNKSELENCLLLNNLPAIAIYDRIFGTIIIPHNWLMNGQMDCDTLMYSSYSANQSVPVILQSTDENKTKMRMFIEKLYARRLELKEQELKRVIKESNKEKNKSAELLEEKHERVLYYEKKWYDACFYRNIFGSGFFACLAMLAYGVNVYNFVERAQ